jgi:hypothetical protein
MKRQDAMTGEKPFDAERYVEATSAALGLPIPQDLRADVIATFGQMADTAAFLMAMPIDDEIDPAVVYRP